MIKLIDHRGYSGPLDGMWGTPIVKSFDRKWYVCYGVDYETEFWFIPPKNQDGRPRHFKVVSGPYKTRKAAKVAYLMLYGDERDVV